MNDLRLVLTRDKPQRERTFGVLSTFDGRKLCETLEPGTDDRDYPRVPTGFYSLEPHSSEQAWIGETFALIGDNVSHFPEDGVDRYAILIHAGNVDDDTQGCVIVGQNRGLLVGEPGVLSSRKALARVLSTIRGADRAFLTIR